MTNPSASSARTPEPPACRTCKHPYAEHTGRSLYEGSLRPAKATMGSLCEHRTDFHHTCPCGQYVAATPAARTPEQPSPSLREALERLGGVVWDTKHGKEMRVPLDALASPEPNPDGHPYEIDGGWGGERHDLEIADEPTPDSGLDLSALADFFHEEYWSETAGPHLPKEQAAESDCSVCWSSAAKLLARLARKPVLSGDEPPVVLGYEDGS